MTIGAAFACAYRRDLARQTRNAVTKRAQNQKQASQTQTKALSSSAASNEPKKETEKLSDAQLLGVDVSEKIVA